MHLSRTLRFVGLDTSRGWAFSDNILLQDNEQDDNHLDEQYYTPENFTGECSSVPIADVSLANWGWRRGLVRVAWRLSGEIYFLAAHICNAIFIVSPWPTLLYVTTIHEEYMRIVAAPPSHLAVSEYLTPPFRSKCLCLSSWWEGWGTNPWASLGLLRQDDLAVLIGSETRFERLFLSAPVGDRPARLYFCYHYTTPLSPNAFAKMRRSGREERESARGSIHQNTRDQEIWDDSGMNMGFSGSMYPICFPR